MRNADGIAFEGTSPHADENGGCVSKCRTPTLALIPNPGLLLEAKSDELGNRPINE